MTTVAIDWEAEIVALLDEISQVQDDLLETLIQKRECMGRMDLEGMTALDAQEQEVCKRLEACQQRRQQLLRAARQRHLPGMRCRKCATSQSAKAAQ